MLAVWVVLVVFVVYILRGPLKLSENFSYGKLTVHLCMSRSVCSSDVPQFSNFDRKRVARTVHKTRARFKYCFWSMQLQDFERGEG